MDTVYKHRLRFSMLGRFKIEHFGIMLNMAQLIDSKALIIGLVEYPVTTIKTLLIIVILLLESTILMTPGSLYC